MKSWTPFPIPHACSLDVLDSTATLFPHPYVLKKEIILLMVILFILCLVKRSHASHVMFKETQNIKSQPFKFLNHVHWIQRLLNFHVSNPSETKSNTTNMYQLSSSSMVHYFSFCYGAAARNTCKHPLITMKTSSKSLHLIHLSVGIGYRRTHFFHPHSTNSTHHNPWKYDRQTRTTDWIRPRKQRVSWVGRIRSDSTILSTPTQPYQ